MCNSLCSGPVDGWVCSGGDIQSPSICSPKCGDGKVIGNEKCDAGSKLGCTEDCLSNLSTYECIGGNSTSATICTLIDDSKSE